jgi:1,5-anhydro-D-fructose reductase (1,5-anhydro-D-mannitol-forming)
MVPAMRLLGHDVAAVCGGDADRVARWAHTNGIPHSTTSVDDVLEHADAVYVSSTNDKHAAQAIAAISAGKHVLCEKPIALATSAALAVVEAADRAGVVLGTNHHLRNSPVHRLLHDLVRDGVIGRLLAVRVDHAVLLPRRLRGWRIDRDAPGSGVVLDITVHDADTLRFVTGLEARAVTAVGAAQGGTGVVDAVAISGLLEEGVLWQSHDAFTVEHAGTSFTLHGSNGSLVATDAMSQDPDGTVMLLRAGSRTDIAVPDRDDLYVRGLARFDEAVHHGGTPAATGADGVRSLATALAVAESLETGRTTEVPAAGLTSTSGR